MNNLIFRSFLPKAVIFLSFALTVSLHPTSAQVACVDSAQINPNILCPTIYQPVCGCNGVTYGNSCEAFNWGGVTSWTEGACSSCTELEVFFNAFWITHTNTVTFQDLSSFDNGIITSWQWSFGDGSFSSEQNPSHTYAGPANYNVCLTVHSTDSLGNLCVKTFCKEVNIPIDCFDNCLYDVDVDIDGIAIRAALEPGLPDTPFFFYVIWSLDNGAVTGNGLEFFQQITEPGIHTLCASYPTGDFSPELCTVCKAFEINAPCINPEQIDSVACPLAFIPVCGCDGVTYNNACEAYNWAGVTSWVPGVCGSVCNNLHLDFEGFNSGGALTTWTFNDKSLFPGGQVTGWLWDFGNGATSMEQNPTINFLEPGDYQVCLFAFGTFSDGTQCGSNVCKTIHVDTQLCVDPSVIDTNTICPAVYAPVCGCDGITYANDCVAYYEHGVTEWVPGICPSICINPAWVDTTQPCIEIYDPVCGCDGQDYDNECFALIHGVTSWQKGVCCQNLACRALFSITYLPNRTILLKNQSINDESSNLVLGDGSFFGGPFDSLYHTYTQNGIFQICLEISNLFGNCSDTYCAIVDFSTSGTKTPASAFNLNIAPNPTSGDVWITLDEVKADKIVVYDMQGNPVAVEENPANITQFNTQLWPSGIYFVHIQSNLGGFTSKIVVQH